MTDNERIQDMTLEELISMISLLNIFQRVHN